MDLLTVVMHELGHVLGLGDVANGSGSDSLMTTQLPTGVRRLPGRLSGHATVSHTLAAKDLIFKELGKGAASKRTGSTAH
jgi:hypothetical protein